MQLMTSPSSEVLVCFLILTLLVDTEMNRFLMLLKQLLNILRIPDYKMSSLLFFNISKRTQNVDEETSKRLCVAVSNVLVFYKPHTTCAN